MIVHACAPNTWRLKQEHCEVEASLVYIARPCERKKRKERRKAGRREEKIMDLEYISSIKR
jgi:hypothetical protein